MFSLSNQSKMKKAYAMKKAPTNVIKRAMKSDDVQSKSFKMDCDPMRTRRKKPKKYKIMMEKTQANKSDQPNQMERML